MANITTVGVLFIRNHINIVGRFVIIADIR
jgi:hypothetical protein